MRKAQNKLPSPLPFERIGAYLDKVHSYTERRRVRQALCDPDQRAHDFKGTDVASEGRRYYIKLDVTGKELAKTLRGNDRSLWHLKAISEVVSKLRMLLRNMTYIQEIQDKGCYPLSPKLVKVDGISIHLVQLYRNVLHVARDRMDNIVRTTAIYDTMHFILARDDGAPIDTKAAGPCWTNGYDWDSVDQVFLNHENETAKRNHRDMTNAALWAHAEGHQEASRLADPFFPECLERSKNVLPFSMSAQVGGSHEIGGGLLPQFFDIPSQYQLSTGFGGIETRPRISFDSQVPIEAQVLTAKEEIIHMVKNGPPMWGPEARA